MRNAVGSAWIFGICLTFTIMFTAYMAISVNYARTNQMKSKIVSMVEEHEGVNEDLTRMVEEYIESEGYSTYGVCQNDYNFNDTDWIFLKDESINSNAPSGYYNVCIYREAGNASGKDAVAPRSRYRVETFMKFDIPVVKYLLSIKVAGETKYFYDFAQNP